MIYFEVFIMGLETGIFSNGHALLTLSPILDHPQSPLYPLMITTYVRRLKEQFTRQVGPKCKRALVTAIRTLFHTHHVHRVTLSDQ